MSKAGPFKFRFCQRLGQSYHDLADYFDIKQRDRWEKGRECWSILEWLEERARLNELQEALEEIERQDLAAIAQEILSSIDMEDALQGKFQEVPKGNEWQDLSSIDKEGLPYNQDILSYSPTSHELAAGIAQREAAYGERVTFLRGKNVRESGNH